MAQYFPESLAKKASPMSPEGILGKLFYFRDQAHLLHFQTTSFAEHKTLDFFYSALDGWVDKFGELLLGYISPNRYGDIPQIKLNSKYTTQQLVDEVIKFSDEVYDYGESTEWLELCNFAADLSGDAVKTKYLLTLK